MAPRGCVLRIEHSSRSSTASSRLTLVAVSNTLADQLSRDLQLPVLTMRSAFDPAVLPFGSAHARTGPCPVGIAPGQYAGTGCGRTIRGQEGFCVPIEAFTSASQQRPDLRLVIIGEGSTRAALQARIDHLGLGARVSLPGHLNDAAQLYSAFDWVAIPSLERGVWG